MFPAIAVWQDIDTQSPLSCAGASEMHVQVADMMWDLQETQTLKGRYSKVYQIALDA